MSDCCCSMALRGAGGTHGQVYGQGMEGREKGGDRGRSRSTAASARARRAASGALSHTKLGDPMQNNLRLAMALSHMWLDKMYPDANACNLRDIWLPAIEWLYSERVLQLTENPDSVVAGYGRRASAPGGT